jgi:predicted nucleic acid-binding protein
MRIVVDTWCWIELGRGSEYADTVKKYLRSEHNIIAPASIISEIVVKFVSSRISAKELKLFLQMVRAYTNIYPMDQGLAERAGKIYHKLRKRSRDMGIMDAYIYALAIKEKALVLTGDKDFKPFERVIYLE